MTQVNFVAGFANHLPIVYDHAANRVFPGFRFAFPRKGDCPLHPVSIGSFQSIGLPFFDVLAQKPKCPSLNFASHLSRLAEGLE